jgi:hypothetical protein
MSDMLMVALTIEFGIGPNQLHRYMLLCGVHEWSSGSILKLTDFFEVKWWIGLTGAAGEAILPR